MEPTQTTHTIKELIELRKNNMLSANPEYQRGAVWNRNLQKKLIDSLLRGYPLPIIYLHHIKKGVGKYARDDFEIIDGQQRMNAIYDFCEGAFPLYDPVADAKVARFPAFIKAQACPWGGKDYHGLDDDLKEKIMSTQIAVAMIKTDEVNEVRDLFVRLQSGLPLNNQETRDAWPGCFTEFILRLGGKPELARYPGHAFFRVILGMRPETDRGKTRQLAAQLSMLIITARNKANFELCDINAEVINEFYYDHLDFDQSSSTAKRIYEVFDIIAKLLTPGKHPKLRAHDAIHAALLVESLIDDYTPSWKDRFPHALDQFLDGVAKGKAENDVGVWNEYWVEYGQWTRVNSDRADVIQRRHRFYTEKMYEFLQPLAPKDPKRIFGDVERTILFFQQGKCCCACDGSLDWADFEVHHVEEHSKGGKTVIENGAIVHKACHPKGKEATKAFAKKFAKRKLEIRKEKASVEL